ncbi:MAG TPA: DUF2007 domain-containing protein [Kofleriaceae bacterium]|nr:DUF2007 domain-containing protein [Kofleriaceae bacterium]
MPGRFVIVHRTYDPMQADMLRDLLGEAGVPVRVTGTRSGAIIGVAQNILEVTLAVPESQAGQATDFLEAFFSTGGDGAAADSASALPGRDADGAAPEDDDGEDDDGEDAAAGRAQPLRPLLAAGSAFLTFGVGHLYARRPATALALLLGQLVAMGLLLIGDSWYAWTVGLTALGAIVGCDIVGSMLAARAHEKGVRRGRAWQAAIGLAYVAGALLLAHTVGPRLTDPKAGDPTGGLRQRQMQDRGALEKIDKPLERDPWFPPLTSQHPANPSRH